MAIDPEWYYNQYIGDPRRYGKQMEMERHRYESEIHYLKREIERERAYNNRPMNVGYDFGCDECDCKKSWNISGASKKLLLVGA